MSSASRGWAYCNGGTATTAGGLCGETVPSAASVVVGGGVGGGFPCMVARRVRRARTSCPKLETSDFREPMWRPTRLSTASVTVVLISATAAAVVACGMGGRGCSEGIHIVATSALFLAVAASRVETLSCIFPMSTTSEARLEEVAVTVVWRLAHESLRSAHESRRMSTGQTRSSSSR